MSGGYVIEVSAVLIVKENHKVRDEEDLQKVIGYKELTEDTRSCTRNKTSHRPCFVSKTKYFGDGKVGLAGEGTTTGLEVAPEVPSWTVSDYKKQVKGTICTQETQVLT